MAPRARSRRAVQQQQLRPQQQRRQPGPLRLLGGLQAPKVAHRPHAAHSGARADAARREAHRWLMLALPEQAQKWPSAVHQRVKWAT